MHSTSGYITKQETVYYLLYCVSSFAVGLRLGGTKWEQRKQGRKEGTEEENCISSRSISQVASLFSLFSLSSLSLPSASLLLASSKVRSQQPVVGMQSGESKARPFRMHEFLYDFICSFPASFPSLPFLLPLSPVAWEWKIAGRFPNLLPIERKEEGTLGSAYNLV